MIKLKLILLALILFHVGCKPQSKENKNDMNYKERLREVNKDVEDIDNKPLYNFHYSYSGCQIEILINNKLILKEFGYNTGAYYTPISIHHLFVKEKTQKIKVIVKPLIDEELTNQSSFRIGVSYFKNRALRNNYHQNEDSFFLFQFNTDETINFESFERKINIEGLSYFEKEFQFKTDDIFIKNDFLTNAQDLREVNQDSLKQKVLNQYNKFANSVNNKKEEIFWENWYNKTNYLIEANYLVPINELGIIDIESIIKEAKTIYTQANFPLIEDNYEMIFYDNGKLVCFESKKEDLRLKGKSPLIGTAEQHDGSLYKKPFQFYFYMPKDSNELKIMY